MVDSDRNKIAKAVTATRERARPVDILVHEFEQPNPVMCLTADGVRITKTIPLDAVRRLTSARMLQSHVNSAPVSVMAEADATDLVALRKKLNAALEKSDGTRISFTPFFVKIVADVLTGHPQLNATLCGEELQLLDEINIGVALALPDGNLIVPVVREVDKLSVIDVAHYIDDLVDRANRKKLKPADMRGGTFTVTNGGMFHAIRWTTPILNMPQCAILGPGAITPTPVVRDGNIVVRSMVALSLTFDHRVINGFPASQFLQSVAERITDPRCVDLGFEMERTKDQ